MITKENRAFLLIEVLVTVAVVSTCIVFINHAFTSSLKAAGVSGDYLSAVLLLEDKGFDLELNPKAETGESSDITSFMGKDFSWTQEVSPLGGEDSTDSYKEEDLRLNRLKLSLKWQRQEAERSIDILTCIRAAESEE